MFSNDTDRFFRVIVDMKDIADLHQSFNIIKGSFVTCPDFFFIHIVPTQSDSCGNACNIDISIYRQHKNTLYEIAFGLWGSRISSL